METFFKVFTVFFALAVMICGLALLMALPTMWLWNALIPDIFGLTVIGFWQALGLNVLSGILFKSSTSSSKS